MTTPGTADEWLIGRADELRALDDFVRSAWLSGGVHLVTGDAGSGKSALLEAAARAAETRAAEKGAACRVLRAAGVEFETDLGYAGLHQLLLPVVNELSDLPHSPAAAIRAALGLEATTPPELLPLTAAVVGFLRHLRRAGPLLLLVDDLQWVDRNTLLLLSLLSRRLDQSGVAVFLARRSGHETVLDRVTMPTIELPALSDADAHALMQRHYPHLHPTVRRRIVADAEGNPLALIELPRGLSSAQEAATEILPPTLPLSLRLRRLFASRISTLPPPSRLLLLLAALHYGDGAELMRIVAGSSRDLGPAEIAGLVTVDPLTRELTFTHPADPRRRHRAGLTAGAPSRSPSPVPAHLDRARQGTPSRRGGPGHR